VLEKGKMKEEKENGKETRRRKNGERKKGSGGK
jgi:hypothetical protein